MKSLLTVISAGLLATAGISAQAADIEIGIDDFDQDQAVVSKGPGETGVDSNTLVLNANPALLFNGATRENEINKLTGGASTEGQVATGFYSLSNGAAETKGTGTITWTGLSVDLSFAQSQNNGAFRLAIVGGDAASDLGTPIRLSVTSSAGTESRTRIVTAPVQTLIYDGFTLDMSNVTSMEMFVDGGARIGIDIDIDMIDAIGDFTPPNCVDKSFTGVPSDNPLLAGTEFATTIKVNTNGVNSLTLNDSMSPGLAVASMGDLDGCTSTASDGDTTFSIVCNSVTPGDSLTFNYTTKLTADFGEGTVSNSVTQICGKLDSSAQKCGSVSGCTDSITRTPPPPIPGITLYGLTAGLLGLPMIGGLLIGRRRRKAKA